MPAVLTAPPTAAELPEAEVPEAEVPAPEPPAGPPAWAPRPIPAGQVFRLSGVSYDQYVTINDALPPGAVLTSYADGELQLMTTSTQHEEFKELIGWLVAALADVRGLFLKPLGNVTLRRAARTRGFEPDDCFYLDMPRGAFAGLTPEQLPPPALVLEVEVSRTVLDRLPIYAAVGVPEVWRCDGAGGVTMLELAGGPGGEYTDAAESRLFPGATPTLLGEALAALPDLAPLAYQLAAAEFFRDRLAG